MNIDRFYNNLLKLDYILMFNRNNFNIYQAENNYLISGIIKINKDKLVNHLLNNDSLLNTHSSILKIINFPNNNRFIKTKLKSDYIDYPVIDRFEEWKIYKIKNKTLIYSKLKYIPENIKEKQCLDYVTYLESGYFLTVIEEINNKSKVDIFVYFDDLNPILIPALMKNITIILKELKNI